MAGEHMKKVHTGDPQRIHHQTFNTFIDAAQWVKAHQQNRGAGSGLLGYQPHCVVPIRNDSGSDVDRFGVLGIADLVPVTHTSNADEFLSHITLCGDTPDPDDHFGHFAVTLEPIGNGNIGLAVIQGLVQVAVNILDADHDYADVELNEFGRLESNYHGGGRILFRSDATGEQQCVIHIAPVSFRYAICNALTKGAVASGDGTYTVDNVTPMLGASPVAESTDEITVTNRYGDDIDDNAAVSIEYADCTGTWQTGQITCPA